MPECKTNCQKEIKSLFKQPIISTANDWLANSIKTISKGGVVALAYEHLFGLAADAMNPDAVARSAAIKDRPTIEKGNKPISVILPNTQSIFRVAKEFSPLAQKLADKYWPGPLTILVKAKPHLPLPLLGLNNLLGVRVPGSSPAATLATACDKILTASSANRSNGADPLTHIKIVELEGVDLVVPGTVTGPPGSTVVDATGENPVVLRQGIIFL